MEVHKIIETFKNSKNLKEAVEIKKQLLDIYVVPLQKSLVTASTNEKSAIGKKLNIFKNAIENTFSEIRNSFKSDDKYKDLKDLDLSICNWNLINKSFNPLSQIRSDLINLFNNLDFLIESGKEIVTIEENFENLKVPKDHPSRSTQETFYINDSTILRPHCTVHSINRLKKSNGKEEILKVATIGCVYRRDDETSRHIHQFSQLDFLWLQKGLKVSNLKYLLELLVQKIFGQKHEYRFRNSYFPFTQPSVEVDVKCWCNLSENCNLCKGSGWIEILGAGLFRKEILKESGYSSEYECLAGGLGIERLALLKYRIEDIRLLYSGNLDFLKDEYDHQ